MAINELVGIQGFAGSNHEIAARKLYGEEVLLDYMRTFAEVFAKLKSGTVDRAVVAFSNTTVDEAFVDDPWREMKTHGTDYWLTSKTELLIRHDLLGLPGATLDAIASVHSMDVALKQCRQQLHALVPGAQLVDEDDTALSARNIMEDRDLTKAAVATPLAGGLYGLQVLAENIQDDKQNTTSFYGWSLREDGLARMTGDENKTLMFVRSQNPNVAGALNEVTKAFSDHAINLADFHSISIPGSGRRKKQFFIEADVGFETSQMRETLKTLGEIGCMADLLGSWIDTIDAPLVLDKSTV